MEIRQDRAGEAAPIRRRRLHRVRSVDFLTEHTYRLTIERGEFAFRAGQCVNIGSAGAGLNREYSTYSSEQDDELAFLIRRVNGGLVSENLAKLGPGDHVELDGPYGEFCIANPNDGRRYVLVCTGTGIAPFHSFVASYPGLNYTVVHGVRNIEECYDRESYHPGRYVACISQAGGGQFSGRVTAYLSIQGVDRAAVYYLCGNSAMINDVYDLLREHGVPGDNIYTETFF
ncbi:MAG: oxidoreductase [Candidatus Lambdaproteobacteria bacterium]|nr:oxidoreductase [Candidatus Lambdaproteobacteria bacterium]